MPARGEGRAVAFMAIDLCVVVYVRIDKRRAVYLDNFMPGFAVGSEKTFRMCRAGVYPVASNRRNRCEQADQNGQCQKATQKNRHLVHVALLNAELAVHWALRNEGLPRVPNRGAILSR